MSRTVIWLDSVTSSIAGFYQLALSDIGNEIVAIIRGLARIVEALERDPANCGESRDGSLRILEDVPIVIDFEFFEDDRIAVVLKARYCPGPLSE